MNKKRKYIKKPKKISEPRSHAVLVKKKMQRWFENDGFKSFATGENDFIQMVVMNDIKVGEISWTFKREKKWNSRWPDEIEKALWSNNDERDELPTAPDRSCSFASVLVSNIASDNFENLTCLKSVHICDEKSVIGLSTLLRQIFWLLHQRR